MNKYGKEKSTGQLENISNNANTQKMKHREPKKLQRFNTAKLQNIYVSTNRKTAEGYRGKRDFIRKPSWLQENPRYTRQHI